MDSQSKERICQHMNEDHSLSVYAMAMNYLYQSGKHSVRTSSSIKNAKLVDITLKDYTISFVYCNGDICSMERVTIPFRTPMSSPSDARIWMKDEHNRVLTPLWSYMYKDPMVWIILVMCTSLALGWYYGLTDQNFWNYIPIDVTSSSKSKFEIAVTASLVFAIVAHALEAMYISYLCQSQAKISFRATFLWFLMICLTGYPIKSKYFQLMEGAKAKKPKSG